jgi:fructokinase
MAADSSGPGRPIVVAGEALVDLILRPDGSLGMAAGGGPYNVARTIARLGQPSRFLGCLSTDALGRSLRGHLVADGVDLSLAVATEAPTTLALAELDADGVATYRFYTEGTAAPALLPVDVPTSVAEARALHVGTLGLALEPIASTLAGVVAAAGPETLVMVDPNCRPTIVRDAAAYRERMWTVLRRADVVKVSADDLAFLVPGVSARDAIVRVAAAGPGVVLLTDGARSVTVLARGEQRDLPVPPARVVDTVGAGDAFGGAFLAWWMRAGRGVAELRDVDAVVDAVEMAIEVARRTCERAGAEPPTLGELLGGG